MTYLELLPSGRLHVVCACAAVGSAFSWSTWLSIGADAAAGLQQRDASAATRADHAIAGWVDLDDTGGTKSAESLKTYIKTFIEVFIGSSGDRAFHRGLRALVVRRDHVCDLRRLRRTDWVATVGPKVGIGFTVLFAVFDCGGGRRQSDSRGTTGRSGSIGIAFCSVYGLTGAMLVVAMFVPYLIHQPPTRRQAGVRGGLHFASVAGVLLVAGPGVSARLVCHAA